MILTQAIPLLLQASSQRLTAAIIALALALLIALISVSGMKAKLKSVKKERTANQYVRQGSMNLRSQSDLFLHRNVTRSPRAAKTDSRG
ncbi:MAG: hypothetical protein WDA02_08180 [Saccharofermentanales bacterium]